MNISPRNARPNLESGNHPLAPRMTAIAFLAYNLVMGCIFGSYGVLMVPIETQLGLTRDVSSLGVPLLLLAISVSRWAEQGRRGDYTVEPGLRLAHR